MWATWDVSRRLAPPLASAITVEVMNHVGHSVRVPPGLLCLWAMVQEAHVHLSVANLALFLLSRISGKRPRHTPGCYAFDDRENVLCCSPMPQLVSLQWEIGGDTTTLSGRTDDEMINDGLDHSQLFSRAEAGRVTRFLGCIVLAAPMSHSGLALAWSASEGFSPVPSPQACARTIREGRNFIPQIRVHRSHENSLSAAPLTPSALV